jgi:hypothetical protein
MFAALRTGKRNSVEAALFWRAAMRRTATLWEVFVSRFVEAFEQYQRHRLTAEEAGELLGMSGRRFRRLCVRYHALRIVLRFLYRPL